MAGDPMSQRETILWAVVLKPKRGAEWIDYYSIRRTRKAAIAAFNEDWQPDFAAHRKAGKARAAKVSVRILP